MKLTENRLRKIIRNVLVEKLGLNKTYKKKKHGSPFDGPAKTYGGGGHSGGYYDDAYADSYMEADGTQDEEVMEEEDEAMETDY